MSRSFALDTIAVLWVVFLGYWALAARHVKRARRRESAPAQILDTVSFWLVFLLFLFGGRLLVLSARFMPPASATLLIAYVVTTALGLLLAVWARRHLGRDWAPTVAIKEDQALIRSGPFGASSTSSRTGLPSSSKSSSGR